MLPYNLAKDIVKCNFAAFCNGFLFGKQLARVKNKAIVFLSFAYMIVFLISSDFFQVQWLVVEFL